MNFPYITLRLLYQQHQEIFGVKASYYGFTQYNETQAALAYARKLSDKIDIGVQFNYNALKIAGYGNAGAISDRST